MDALIPAFIAAALGEIGDRTQLLAVLLALRFGRPGAVFAGIAAAAIVNMGLAGAAGAALDGAVPHRALRLLTGVALILSGGGALLPVKPPPSVDRWRSGAAASSFAAFLVLEFGDGSQFAVAAIAGASRAPILAAVGGALGVIAATVPAVAFARQWQSIAAMRSVRYGAGGALALAGAIVAVAALEIG